MKPERKGNFVARKSAYDEPQSPSKDKVRFLLVLFDVAEHVGIR